MGIAFSYLHLLLLPTLLASSTSHSQTKKESYQSLSCGSANRGRLIKGVRLPEEGVGYVTPTAWLNRSRRFGTKRMIGLIEDAARYVEKTFPGSILGVADISAVNGGPIGLHRSHQSGRDVDLIFYALNDSSLPFKPDSHMAYYGSLGEGVYSRAPHRNKKIDRRYFDLARNWALISYLVSQKEVEVTHAFVSRRVKSWLLQYAKHLGVPKTQIAIARKVLKKDKNGLHNDHFHIRIGCSMKQRTQGVCFESGSDKALHAYTQCTELIQNVVGSIP